MWSRYVHIPRWLKFFFFLNFFKILAVQKYAICVPVRGEAKCETYLIDLRGYYRNLHAKSYCYLLSKRSYRQTERHTGGHGYNDSAVDADQERKRERDMIRRWFFLPYTYVQKNIIYPCTLRLRIIEHTDTCRVRIWFNR